MKGRIAAAALACCGAGGVAAWAVGLTRARAALIEAFAHDAVSSASRVADRLAELHTIGGAGLVLGGLVTIALGVRRASATGALSTMGVGVVGLVLGTASLVYGVRLSVLLARVPHRGDARMLMTLRR